ncbi:TlpA disulfide reductase family protein [Roseibium aggregatum]|uniref:TlpA family protein disulfide reductase n=1 Tax=Roseibium aggregatum TaxID=187304 RepID=A0A939J4T0_9HYPH|nr:TlpA disulfide reductase family protein [Roseibium aggregatum]MBN9671937.1 TlpA family protein disulfide reductase [Roseibium aggregatum]
MGLINRRDVLVGGTLLAVTAGRAQAGEEELHKLGLARPPFAIDDPVLNVPDLAGAVHRIEDYRGKTVVVSFWATWCPPCRKELPTLAGLSRELAPDRFAVLAVNIGDNQNKIQSFLDRIDHDGLPVLMDKSGKLSGKWYLRGMPVTYVVDGSGDVILAAIGERVWDSPEMIAALTSLG